MIVIEGQFVDGVHYLSSEDIIVINKALMMSGYIFLLLNGYELTAPGDDIVEMAEGLACKFYSREELEDWLAYWGRSFDTRYLCLKSSHPYMSFMQIDIDLTDKN